jgi:hypothetical protein
VGYTDQRGQTIFDIEPSSVPSFINVTVTKHNHKPHLGNMTVIDSQAAIHLFQQSGIATDPVYYSLIGYPQESASVFVDEKFLGSIQDASQWYGMMSIPRGENGYINVWIAIPIPGQPFEMWGPVSVNRLERISDEEGPDPYIYSKNAPRTWAVTGEEFVWDNPDIIIRHCGEVVSSMTQGEVHEIEVIVHNRGSERATPTNVTLSYAPFGGGVSWREVGEARATPEPGGSDSVYFLFNPPYSQGACLRVQLSDSREWPRNEIDNIGFENVGVIEMSSPGVGSFLIGNPKTQTNYVSIKVKQQGSYPDVWNATIFQYSSQVINASLNETISLSINSTAVIPVGEGRVFTVDLFINCELVGGMVINATRMRQSLTTIQKQIIIGIVILVLIIAIVLIIKPSLKGGT